MPSYKLSYFDLRSRGEIIRLLFTYGDIPFEDHRVTFQEWPAFKQTTPFKGGLPTLTIDGAVYTQSLPLTRYVANLVGLGGDTALDQLRADQIVAQLSDMRFYISPIMRFQPDEKVKKEKMAAFEKDDLPKTMDRLEQMVNEHGYLVSDKLNYADIYLMDTWETLKVFDLSKYPKLKKLYERVSAIPKLAAYIEKRTHSIV